ncbi:selenide, water dikinase SelD [Aestuariirhabdus sp. Z084]|uniref:selenide, water dikinase SelD n=1 Tax=Aestuariirhabdus haliotis TaxID=2918751 RepID=UPI00201B4452|nr:selenide, water dikinase SelD [Aestuariirhabdus haliotis]MCL6414028.1 selenide, water dikinase SelD [Aestuariirhabdus haliotis]MCL6417961.1 selenide, water dikinase SelD [Aestuariirhabdus haliotis]
MKSNSSVVVKDLVLVGGGHAHVAVLKRLGMKPVPGLRITLVTRDIHTPYSGMLPGYVAGLYDYDDCHIDLGPLARFAGARLYHASVEQLDLGNQQILASHRPPIHYDLLSINTGSRPGSIDVPGVDEFALAAKPIDRFLIKWQQLVSRVLNSSGPFRILVVGGGAGGVELALSTQHRLQQALVKAGGDPGRLHYSLVTQSEGIMFMHNPGVRQRFERIFNERHIQIQTNRRVIEVSAQGARLDDGSQLDADAIIWVTTASAPSWLAASGLAVDEAGFVRVDKQLRSISHPAVFAAGDIAALPNPRPKSGVFAVRQGPILAHNLRAAASGQALRPYRPQKNFLGLISTGNRYAIASHGNWSHESATLWRLKNWIDKRFMRQFNELPKMAEPESPELASGIADAKAIKELSTLAMRCGGCGAKVGATVLNRVMQRLPNQQRDDVLIGRDGADDCAMLAVPDGKVMVQSVDYFRAFIDDTYTFGAIAANHAMGDLYAMGAEPQSVLAIATVPYGRERVVEETLYDVLAGALHTLEPTGAVLAGGHSSEGAELAFGLTVNGLIDPDRVWRKSGLQAGDVLILTKPVGTGTLFAADMRGKAKGRWVDAAITSMLQSSQQAAACLQQFGASACTDLTGFGIVGHLIEMTKASQVDAVLDLDALPLLDGALDTVAAGILSSLQPQNLRLRRAIQDIEHSARHPAFPLLFDPQTAGGLLAGVPSKQADACILALRERGYREAVIIGRIEPLSDQQAPIRIE